MAVHKNNSATANFKLVVNSSLLASNLFSVYEINVAGQIWREPNKICFYHWLGALCYILVFPILRVDVFYHYELQYCFGVWFFSFWQRFHNKCIKLNCHHSTYIEIWLWFINFTNPIILGLSFMHGSNGMFSQTHISLHIESETLYYNLVNFVSFPKYYLYPMWIQWRKYVKFHTTL